MVSGYAMGHMAKEQVRTGPDSTACGMTAEGDEGQMKHSWWLGEEEEEAGLVAAQAQLRQYPASLRALI